MALRHAFGVDMGTGTVKIYDLKNDSITKESDMAAVRDGETVFAIGNDAYNMYERTPQDIEIIRPMSNGRIHDVLMMEAVLHTLLGRCSSYVGYSPTLFFSVPMDMTEIERRAYSTVARKGRFRRSRVFMVEKPVADAIAIGIPILRTPGAMLVNMGDQSTEVSIIADRRVIISRMIPIGGQDITTGIMEGIRKKNSFIVSRKTAQRLKLTLADLSRDPNEGCKVGGLDVPSGLPRDGIVSSANVSISVARVVQEISDEILKIMQRIPPQIRTIVAKDGLYLTGGSAHIPGIGAFLEGLLGCPIRVSGYYELSTVCGLKEIMTHSELSHWAFVGGKKSSYR